ncbi:ABC transporter substrate-binding protein [Glycomyces paridis]|uniref:ABC transporter substrate-binding protein n=1 Tax=Glycomyces paridis TaxID=2126555 RepID=A0A4S8P888_9ACTN|nr:ABC transporter substrate-binding protein [Glycomyces paridis]THV26437.1 ABC transporter substrate-binding protein [Glycomyces paridis]
MHLTAITRRGALGLAGAALLAGCGGTGAEPKHGGTLRAAFAGGGAAETLDPHRVNLFADAARAKAMYDKLADLGGDMAAVPRLAESWEGNADLTVWTVRLREAVFHDGAPLTAADVLYSYRRITDPEETFRAGQDLAPIDLDASRAVDDRTVEFVLRHPLAEFPASLAAFGAYIVPEGADDFTAPVGTGPFTFAAFEPGRSFAADRFADHWDGPALLDRLEIVVADEESARVNALLGGQVDYAHDLSATTARANEGDDAITLLSSPGSNMLGFAMKTDRAPFDDPRVRQAMFLLCDREALLESVLSGRGLVGNDLFGLGFEHYADAIPQRERDVEAAKALLAEAGVPGLSVVLDTAEVGAGLPEAARIFAEQLREGGVQVELNVRNADTYWSEILTEGQIASYRSGAMPIASHLSQRLLTDSPTNLTAWRDADFDDRYLLLQSTADETDRQALYDELQQRLHDEGGYLVWGFADWIVGTAAHVRGVEPAPANTLDWARFDKVWTE